MRPDLNLLVILDALCRTGSVSRAAATLSLSQPAVSHALNRLRVATGDPLFTRSGRGLVPTARAQTLTGEVAGIVAAGQACLRVENFDPARDFPNFRLAMGDYAGLTLLPHLVAAVAVEAPQARIEAFPVGRDLLRQLEDGSLDLSFWGTDAPPPPFLYELLSDDEFVVVLRRDHPHLREKGGLSLQAYLELGHAVVSLGDPGRSPVEAALARIGQERRVVLTSSSFAINLAAVAQSDLVATVPCRLAQTLPSILTALPLPFDVSGFAYGMIWHPRGDASPALLWLRRLIRRLPLVLGAQRRA